MSDGLNVKEEAMSKVNFKERQRYDNKWVPVLLGVTGLVAFGKGIYFLTASDVRLENAVFLFLVALGAAGLIWWLHRLEMKVTITEKKVKFKLSPLHPKKQSIAWKEIGRCEIVKTSEAAQWSGGNITFNEKRYSLNGRNGLAIRTKSGESYFIGCKNVEKLQQTLQAINVG